MKIKNVGKQGAFQLHITTKHFSIMVYKAKDWYTKRHIKRIGKNNPFFCKHKIYLDIYI